MSEKIEQVAKALLASDQAEGHADAECTYLSYMKAARIAIEAMRDPTDAMEEAGEDLDDWGVPSDPGSGNASALAHWHAMIDAALK